MRAFSLDLHVLGTPPAFVLSQDQTLQLSIGVSFPSASTPDLAAKRGQAVHSKHCEFRNPSSWTCYPVFRDRPTTPLPDCPLPTTLPPRRLQHPGEGRASYRCSCCASRALLPLSPPPSSTTGGHPDLPGPRCLAAWDCRCQPPRRSDLVRPKQRAIRAHSRLVRRRWCSLKAAA